MPVHAVQYYHCMHRCHALHKPPTRYYVRGTTRNLPIPEPGEGRGFKLVGASAVSGGSLRVPAAAAAAAAGILQVPAAAAAAGGTGGT